MAYFFPAPRKIIKRRGSQLEVRVRKTRPHEVLRPCSLNCNSSAALRISFFTHTRKRYVDSSSSLIGTEQETIGEETICVDKRLFFNSNHKIKNNISFSKVLGSLNVKECLHDKITRQIVSMGECKFKGGKMVKRKIYKGLHVHLTTIQTFLGDQDSVRELFEKSMEEYGMEPSEKGLHFVL